MSHITIGGNPTALNGNFPQKGQTIASFTLTADDLSDKALSDFAGKRKVLNIFPSIDTGVCMASVREFNQRASSLDNTVVLCISADLPFAQKRFCAAEGLEQVLTLSTFRNPAFLRDLGVEIAEGGLRGLCARAVVVLDEENRVLHSELVAELKSEPNYEAAVSVL
ncbi:MAG: thiol peroxidase [Cardiobacteriaceae bacterium]|nr:thiol peroxidase [Cardiobacteriaceae bacterium]